MFVRGKRQLSNDIRNGCECCRKGSGREGCLDNIGRTQGNERKSLPGFQQAEFDPFYRMLVQAKFFCLASGPKEHPG